MQKKNYLEEVLLLIAAFGMLAYVYDRSIDLRFFEFYNVSSNLLAASPVILLGLAVYLFYVKHFKE